MPSYGPVYFSIKMPFITDRLISPSYQQFCKSKIPLSSYTGFEAAFSSFRRPTARGSKLLRDVRVFTESVEPTAAQRAPTCAPRPVVTCHPRELLIRWAPKPRRWGSLYTVQRCIFSTPRSGSPRAAAKHSTCWCDLSRSIWIQQLTTRTVIIGIISVMSTTQSMQQKIISPHPPPTYKY